MTLAAVAYANDEVNIPAPLGVRLRATNPTTDAAVEASFAATWASAAERTSYAVDCIASIGSNGSQTTGTFNYSLTVGRLYGSGEHHTSGLSLRGGGAVLVDAFGPFRASYLALPLGQLGFAHSSQLGRFDFGAQAAPILTGRLRHEDSIRWLGYGSMAGPYFNFATSFASLHICREEKDTLKGLPQRANRVGAHVVGSRMFAFSGIRSCWTVQARPVLDGVAMSGVVGATR